MTERIDCDNSNRAYRLVVSRDCGSSYVVEAWGDCLEDFTDETEELDKEMLRWAIETNDDKAAIHAASAIHMAILASMDKILGRPNTKQ